MELLLKSSFEFFRKYIKEYLRLLVKPILIGILGFFVMGFMLINPLFSILGLFITIPCIFYSFWRGIMITYTLNYAAYNMYKKGSNHSLKELFVLTKKNEKDLALWISCVALLSVLGYLPSFIFSFVFTPVSFFEIFNFPNGTMNFLQNFMSFKIMLVYILNTLVLVPFLNYSQQVFYFKKPQEKFLNLVLNCYKKIDMQGYFIALLVIIGGFILTSNSLLIILTLFFNVFIYGLNMFWWAGKNSEK